MQMLVITEDDADADDFGLSSHRIAFLRGVFAARGITAPTEQEFADALELLQRYAWDSKETLN
jgi:hypothetical protein